ncbi:unnamed protein product, partial [Mesorhabditis belari]|uniref:Uncharacterized protein n=1 Tax=Mesorhabditis belari TaxID=2138241 RepID=A0AAF3EAF2_9BILA
MGGAQTSIADDSSVPPADQVPDATFEAVALVTLPFCVVLFIFSLFSRSTDPKRWHMLNLSAWMFWQLVLYSNIAEQSPLRNFLHDESIWLSSEQWLMLNMSVISTGLILLYLESLISAILCVFLVKPRETFRRFYTLVWFILMLIVPNIAQGYCMYLEV